MGRIGKGGGGAARPAVAPYLRAGKSQKVKGTGMHLPAWKPFDYCILNGVGVVQNQCGSTKHESPRECREYVSLYDAGCLFKSIRRNIRVINS